MDVEAAARQRCVVKTIARALAWLATIILLAGCATPPKAQMEALRPPQSLLQLFEAIWQVNQSGLALRDEFYTVDNLKRAFGGADVELQIGKFDVLIGSYWGEIGGFPSWMPQQATERLEFRRQTYHPDGDLDASFILRCNFPQVRRADIERLFGTNWKQEPHVIMRHGMPEELPMRPDANMSMVYSAGDRRSGWMAAFAFNAEGVLTSVGVESHQTK
jgi:hypothetical protein